MLHFRFVVQGLPVFVVRCWADSREGGEVRVSGLSFSDETDAGLLVAV